MGSLIYSYTEEIFQLADEVKNLKKKATYSIAPTRSEVDKQLFHLMR
jgi:hypothetical protein